MSTLIHFLISYFIRHPKAAGLFGLAFALLFTPLTISSIQEVRRMPSAPQSVSVSDAGALAPISYDQRPWVSIENGVLNCKGIYYEKVGSSTRTQILISDNSGRSVVVAEFSDRLTCGQIMQRPITGLLSKMSDARYKRFLELNEFDLSGYQTNAAYMDLCAFCGPSNSTLGIVVGGALILASLAIYPLVMIEHRKRYPKTGEQAGGATPYGGSSYNRT